MSQETITVIVAVVAIAVALYAVYAAYQKTGTVTLGGVVDAVEEAVPVGQDFAKVAEIAVNAAEQLKRTGQLTDNKAAFDYALTIAQKYLPALDALDSEKLIAAINAAVLVASALTAQIEHAKSEVGKPSQAPMLPRGAMGPKEVPNL